MLIDIRKREEKEAEAERAALLADPRYGATPATRQNRYDLVMQVCIVLTILAVALALYLGFFAQADLLSFILALLAVAVGGAVLIWSDGLAAWLPVGNLRPTVVGAGLPILALTIRASGQYHLVDYTNAILIALAAGITFGALGFLVKVRGQPRGYASVPMALAGAFLAFGAAMYLDVGLDHSVVRPSPMLVVRKWTSAGRYTRYHVQLRDPADAAIQEVSGSFKLYETVEVGDYACFYTHPGALRMAWFDLVACPPGRYLIPRPATQPAVKGS